MLYIYKFTAHSNKKLHELNLYNRESGYSEDPVKVIVYAKIGVCAADNTYNSEHHYSAQNVPRPKKVSQLEIGCCNDNANSKIWTKSIARCLNSLYQKVGIFTIRLRMV